jgi:cardiolipin synthase
MHDLPNILTLLRVLVLPFFVLAFYLEDTLAHYVTFSIFVLASITDYFDGLLARHLKAYSNFGMVLDPIADKLLVACGLMMLVHFDRAPIIPAILIMCREITVSGLREYLAEFKVSIPVSKIAKVKTATQMVAIAILLLGENASGIPWLDSIGIVFIWLAAALTLFTGYAYVKQGFIFLNRH